MASSRELAEALNTHLEETRGQVQRLEQIFTELGEAQTTKKCKGIQALLEEGREAARELPVGATRDAVLIAGAQKVEHYEIATYGTLTAVTTVEGLRPKLAAFVAVIVRGYPHRAGPVATSRPNRWSTAPGVWSEGEGRPKALATSIAVCGFFSTGLDAAIQGARLQAERGFVGYKLAVGVDSDAASQCRG